MKYVLFLILLGGLHLQAAQIKICPTTNLTTQDNFGTSIGTSDNWLAIGNSLDVNQKGAVYVYRAPGLTQSPLFYTKLQGTQTYGEFGARVALDGNLMAISAIGEDGYKGAVYVYSFDSWTGWTQIARITVPGVTSLGIELDLHNNRIAMTSFQPSPQVHVYDVIGSSVVSVGSIGDPVSGGFFGSRVAVSSDFILAGDLQDGATGQIHVFEEVSGSFVLRQSLSGGAGASSYGQSIDVSDDGETLVVGHPLLTTGSNYTGAVYVYKEGASGFNFFQFLPSPTGTNLSRFGNAVAAEGEGSIVHVLVGAPREFVNDGLAPEGVAWRYELNGFTRPSPIMIASSQPSVNEAFGSVVALQGFGDYRYIGAPGGECGSQSDTGAVYFNK